MAVTWLDGFPVLAAADFLDGKPASQGKIVNVLTYKGVDSTGATDSSSGLQAAFNDAAGGLLIWPNGTYLVSAALTAKANTTFLMASPTINFGAVIAGGALQFAAAGIMVMGQYTMSAQNNATSGWVGSSGGNLFRHSATCTASQFPAGSYPLLPTQCNDFRVDGLLRTTDSGLVKADRCSRVTVRGVSAGPYTAALSSGNPPIQIYNSTETGTYRNWTVADIDIDGGATLVTSGVVIRANSATGTAPVGVKASDIWIYNTGASGDGLDILGCQQVTVTGLIGDTVQNAFNCAGSQSVACTASVANLCRGAGFQAGDPTVAELTSLVTFTGCHAIDCGASNTGGATPAAAGFVVFGPAGQATRNVYFNNCIAHYNFDTSVLYGLGLTVGAGGTISNVTISGGTLLGQTAGVLDLATAIVRYVNVDRVQPVAAASLSVGSSPWTYTAGGAGETVYLVGGTVSSVTQNGRNLDNGGLSAAQDLTCTIPGLQSIITTYTGAPTASKVIHNA